jgi:hypothetical protein
MSIDARTRAAIDRHIMNPPELEEEDREPGEDCARPGPHGCGACPGCSDYGDMKFEQKRDRELEERG